MKLNIRRIIELVWLALAAVCTVEFYISLQKIGFTGDTIIFLAAMIISLVMYYIRKRGRKAFENRKRD